MIVHWSHPGPAPALGPLLVLLVHRGKMTDGSGARAGSTCAGEVTLRVLLSSN